MSSLTIAPDALQQIRPVKPGDRRRLAALIHLEPYVHQHPGWRAPLEQLDEEGFVVWARPNALQGALALLPETDEVAWVRLFAAAASVTPREAWQALWPQAVAPFRQRGGRWVAAMPFADWFQRLLRTEGFEVVGQVEVLVWRNQPLPKILPVEGARLRPMVAHDLAAVGQVDAQAFGPFWRMAPSSFEIALSHSVWATVVEDLTTGQILGFQISTPSPLGGHLARLAVHPRAQGRGVGRWLVGDVLSFFKRNRAEQVTLNTQGDNARALALYEKMGFRKTEEAYPVYRYDLLAES